MGTKLRTHNLGPKQSRGGHSPHACFSSLVSSFARISTPILIFSNVCSPTETLGTESLLSAWIELSDFYCGASNGILNSALGLDKRLRRLFSCSPGASTGNGKLSNATDTAFVSSQLICINILGLRWRSSSILCIFVSILCILIPLFLCILSLLIPLRLAILANVWYRWYGNATWSKWRWWP